MALNGLGHKAMKKFNVLNATVPALGGWSFFSFILGVAIMLCDTDPFFGLHRRLIAAMFGVLLPALGLFLLLMFFETRIPRVRVSFLLFYVGACLLFKLTIGTGKMVVPF